MSAEPYYADEFVTLYHGDHREILPQLGLTFDLIVADPPYEETSLEWDCWPDGWPAGLCDFANSMWCFGSMRMYLARRDEFTAWKLSQDIVWEKHNGSGPGLTDRFYRVHESATHWYRGPWAEVHHEAPRMAHAGPNKTWRSSGGEQAPRTAHRGAIGARDGYLDDGTRQVRSVLYARTEQQRGTINGTQKPTSIVESLISYGCPASGTVLDPFAGSCSTGVAARNLGRRSVLVEKRESQCEASAKRLSQGVLDFGSAS
jgi:site-specific DNA-methyltransferase (adenine-specific)